MCTFKVTDSEFTMRMKGRTKEATVGSCDTWGSGLGGDSSMITEEGKKEVVTLQPRVCKSGDGRKNEGV